MGALKQSDRRLHDAYLKVIKRRNTEGSGVDVETSNMVDKPLEAKLLHCEVYGCLITYGKQSSVRGKNKNSDKSY